MMNRGFTYPVNITKDADNFYLVEFPDLPEAATDGCTIEDAMSEAADCLAEAIAARMINGEDIPVPAAVEWPYAVSLETLMAAKAGLYLSLKESGLSKVALAERIGVDEKVIRRLLDPRHKSKLPRIEKALRVLGWRIEMSITPIVATV